MRHAAPPSETERRARAGHHPTRALVRRRRRSAVGIAVGLLVLVSTGCSRDEFPDRTASVEVDGRQVRFDLASCGLDDTTVFVAGSSEDGDVLQAVVGLEEDDLSTGLPAFTGVTVSDGAEERGAFGAGAWEARRRTGEAPGSILGAQLRGARIQVSGRLVLLDATGDPAGTDGSGVPFSLDARCDER